MYVCLILYRNISQTAVSDNIQDIVRTLGTSTKNAAKTIIPKADDSYKTNQYKY